MSKTALYRRLQKLLAVILVITTILAVTAPAAAAMDYDAEGDANELLLANELAAAAETYPNGAFGFYETVMNATEGAQGGVITIVRYGDTSAEAAVTFKAIDVSTKYGQDYTLSVQTDRWLFGNKALKAEEDSQSVLDIYSENLDSVDEGTEALAEQVDGVLSAAENGNAVYALSADTETSGSTVPSAYELNDDTQISVSDVALSDAEVDAGSSMLAQRRNAATGTITERSSEWNAQEAQEKQNNEKNDVSQEESDFMYDNAALAAAYMEGFYSDADGVEYTFTFAPGEYKKVINVLIEDDKLSESEETFMLALYNAGSCSLVNETATYIISDNDEPEEVTFEMAEMNVLAGVNDTYAYIKIRRTSGLNQSAAVKIFTAEGTAQPENDYEAYNDYVVFLPGIEERTIRVKLLTDASDVDTSYFYVGIDTNISKVSGLDFTTVFISGDENLDVSLMAADIDYPSYQATSSATAGRGGNTVTLTSGVASVVDTTGLYQLTSFTFRPTQSGRYISWGGCNSGSVTSYSGRYEIWVNGQYVTSYIYNSTSFKSGYVTVNLSSSLTDNKYHSTNATIQVKFFSHYIGDRNFTDTIDMKYCKLTFSRHGLNLRAENAPTAGINQYQEKKWEGATATNNASYMTLGTLTTSESGNNYILNVKNNPTNVSGAGATPQIGVNVTPVGFQFSTDSGSSWTATYPTDKFTKIAESTGSADYQISYPKLREMLGSSYTDRYGSAKTLRVRAVFSVNSQDITFQTAGGTTNIGYTNGLYHNRTLTVPMLDTVYATATSTALGYGVSGFRLMSGSSGVAYRDLGNGKIMFGVSGTSSPVTCVADYSKTTLAVKYNPKGDTKYISSGAVAYYDDTTKELSYATGSAKSAYSSWAYTGRNYYTPHPLYGWDGLTTGSQLSGSGTLESPYLITSAEELAGLAVSVNTGSNYSGKYLRLDADIDLSDRSWTPIGSVSGKYFAGVFDGNNKIITGLNVLRDTDYSGLFGVLDGGAVVKNLTVSGSVSSTARYTGGICGSLGAGAKLENCVNNCKVTGVDFVGGLAGRYFGGGSVISGCSNNGSVKGTGTAGGIVGGSTDNYDISIAHCVNTGITAANIYAAGIIGRLMTSSNSTVSSCANGGTVTGERKSGGIIGEISGSGNASISNCQNSGSVSGTGSDIGGICGSKTNSGTTEIISCVSSAAGAAFGAGSGTWITASALWDGSIATGLEGSGTALSPYLIQSAAELAYLAAQVRSGNSYREKYFLLTTDIDLASREWLPIGYGTTDSGRYFEGYFDGGGYKITGLKVTSNENGTGLFGSVSGGWLKNLTVSGTVSSLGTCVGGIVGDLQGLMDNCVSYVSVTGNSYVGGLAGNLRSRVTMSSVNNCKNYGSVTANGACSGGITGGTSVVGIFTLSNNINFGSIYSGGNYTGGITGNLKNTAGNTSTISNCYNLGYIRSGSYVGGIIGEAGGSGEINISGCFNTGGITGSGIDIGGICGSQYVIGTANISDCINTAAVTGGTNAGGIAGRVGTEINRNCSLVNCYSSGNITGSNTGGIVGRILPGGSVSGSSYINAASAYGSNTGSYTEGTATVGSTVTLPEAVTLTENRGWDGGSISVWKGSGTKSDPYIISTAAEMAGLSSAVNAGNNMSGKFFHLSNNINLNNLIWTPIGLNTEIFFGGTFDGGGHLIGGLNVTGRDNFNGLFGSVKGAVIKNLAVSGLVAGTGLYTGGVIGAMYAGTSVENCTNAALVSGGTYTGGIVGMYGGKSLIKACINNGAVNGVEITGGLIGGTDNRAALTIEEGLNSASVYGRGSNTGGVGGMLINCQTRGCSNYGSVSGEGVYVGGIAGSLHAVSGTIASEGSALLDGCANYGKITSNSDKDNGIGGIVGLAQGYSATEKKVIIINCVNSGQVSGLRNGYNDAGGVAGNLVRAGIYNCYNNHAPVSGYTRLGGVAGLLDYNSEMSNCFNLGTVSAATYSGSLVGGVANGSEVNYSYWRTGTGYPEKAAGYGDVGNSCVSTTWANKAWELSQNGSGGTKDMLHELNTRASSANSDASALIVYVNANGSTNYDLIGLCNDGYIINWKEGSGDTNGNGGLDADEADILREASQTVYDTWGYSTAGTAYTYTPRLSRSIIYYTVIKDTGGSDEFSLSGGVTIAKAPIFNRSNVTYEAAVGAQVTYAGHSQYTTVDTKRSSGKLYSKFHSDDLSETAIFNENGQYLVNVNFNGLTTSMIVPVDMFRFFELDSYSGINVSADSNKTYIKRNGVKLNLNTQVPAVEDLEYEFRIQTIYGDTQAIKAEFVFCDSSGNELYSKTVNANGYNGGTALGDGSFTLTLNPKAEDFAAGTYGRVTFIGANGVRYYTHDLGIAFMGSISGFDIINESGAESNQSVNIIGNINNSAKLRQDNVDSNEDGELETVMDEASQEVKIITISYGFDEDEEEEDEGGEDEGDKKPKGANDKVEKLKDSSEPKKKTNSSIAKSFDCDAKFAFCLTFVIRNSQLYFQNLLVKVDFHAKASVTLSYMTPVGIKLYVTIAGGINEGSGGYILITRGISTEDTAKSADDMITGGSLEVTDLYSALYQEDNGGTQYDFIAGITLIPFISLTLGADFGGVADISITGSCELTFKFIYSAQKAQLDPDGNGWTNSGTLSASCTLTVKILFITISYKIWSISDVELFADTDEVSALSKPLSEGTVSERGNLKNQSDWYGDAVSLFSVASVAGVSEKTLMTGVNSDPDIQVAAFGEGNLLAVYLDDVQGRSVYNSTAAYYTVYDALTQTWSSPKIIEDDGTFDKTPVICQAGERFFVAWASSNTVFDSEPDTLTALQSTDIHARFFDFETGDFTGDVINVTKTSSGLYEDVFADTEPQAAYYKDEETGNEKLLIYYTKSEYEATGSDGKSTTGDALYPYSVIAYRLYDITNGRFEEYNDSDRTKTESNYKWYYNKYLSYFSSNDVYKAAYDTYAQTVNNYHLGQDTKASCLTAEAIMYNFLQKAIAEETDKDERSKLNTLARYRNYMGWDIDPEAEWDDYCAQMYGQRFLDLAPNVTLTETLDENGYWREGSSVKAKDYSGIDPLVTESEVIAYNGLGLYAYVMDYDGKTSTTTDRDVFLQIYDFYKGTFTHPIMLTSSPELGEKELAFVRAADTTFLTYLTDGADGNEASGNSTVGVEDTSGGSIMAFNVTSNIADGAYRKAHTETGREYYYFDKTNPSISEASSYRPPLELAASFTDEDGTFRHISSFDAAAGGDYIYTLFNFSDVVKKDGGAYSEDDDINDYITNSVYENQVYAVRYNVKEGRSTGIIQVTDGAADSKFKGASYYDIAFALDDEDFIALAEKELSKVVYQDANQNIYSADTPLTETKYYVNIAGLEADILAGGRSHGVPAVDESKVGKYLLRDEGKDKGVDDNKYIDRLGRAYQHSDLTDEQLSKVNEYIYYYSDYTITGTNIKVQASLTTDKDKAELVSLVFNPIPIPTIKNVSIGKIIAGSAVQVGFSVYNEGLEELTNVEVKVTDKTGNIVCELKPDDDEGKGICIYGGLSQDILFGYMVDEADTDVEFTITVNYGGAAAPLVQTIKDSGKTALTVNSFKAEITQRDPANHKVNVHVSGLVINNGDVNAAGAQLTVASGAKTLGTINLSLIKPNTTAGFEADYTVDYDEYFTLTRFYNGKGELVAEPTYTEDSLTYLSSREDIAVFTASVSGSAAESTILFSADSDQQKIMSQAEAIQLIPSSLLVGNGASELGYILTAKAGTNLLSAISATALDPDTNRRFITFKLAAAGLDYRLVSSDETILKVSDNGRYVIPVKEGKAQVYMVLFPASSHARGGYLDDGGNSDDIGFSALNATRIIDNYLTLPQDQLIVSGKAEVTVGTVSISFYDEDKTSLLGTALKNPDGTVSFTEPAGGANRSFAGWVDKNGNPVELFSLIEDTNVYAAYKNAYSVTFYDEDGTTVLSRASAEIRADGTGSIIYPGSTPIKPADNDGSYVFDRWVTSPGGKIEADLDRITTDGMSFYASYKFLPKENTSYTVFFYSEDGSMLLGSSVTTSNTAAYTGRIPEKTGYIFVNWVTAPGGSTIANLSSISEDTSVYASFAAVGPYEPVAPVKTVEQITTDTAIVGSGTTVINSDGSKTTTGSNKRGDTVVITESALSGPDGSEIKTKAEKVTDTSSGASVTKTTTTTVSSSGTNVVSSLTVDVSGTSAPAAFAASAISEIINAAPDKTGITVITDTGKISFNDSAVRKIAEQAGSDASITINASLVGAADLTDEQKSFVESLDKAIIIDLSVSISTKDSASGKLLNRNYISDFGEAAEIEVELPYVLSADEDPFNLAVYFISDDGNIKKHAAVYNPASKTVTFRTKHFSSYVITYQPGVNFTDVRESDWYYSEVGYVAAMGIMQGKGSAYFGALEHTTREQFVTVLYRMAGSPALTASDYAAYFGRFTDVDQKAYYYNAVVWAYVNGITKGLSEDLFGTGVKLTRQQLVTLLCRYDMKTNGSAQASSDLSIYTDAAAVADWAKESMAWAVAEGIIKSYSSKAMTLAPEVYAPRSNMAAIIARYKQR